MHLSSDQNYKKALKLRNISKAQSKTQKVTQPATNVDKPGLLNW